MNPRMFYHIANTGDSYVCFFVYHYFYMRLVIESCTHFPARHVIHKHLFALAYLIPVVIVIVMNVIINIIFIVITSSSSSSISSIVVVVDSRSSIIIMITSSGNSSINNRIIIIFIFLIIIIFVKAIDITFVLPLLV